MAWFVPMLVDVLILFLWPVFTWHLQRLSVCTIITQVAVLLSSSRSKGIL